MKFAHIGIKVREVEKSIKFYQDVLEAKIIDDYDLPGVRLVFMEIGGTVVELIAKLENEERTAGPIEHIAFNVTSLEARMKKLDEMGIVYTPPRVSATGEIIFFDGPNNERFEFAGPKPIQDK